MGRSPKEGIHPLFFPQANEIGEELHALRQVALTHQSIEVAHYPVPQSSQFFPVIHHREQHIAGVAELLALIEVPVHVQAEEVAWVKARAGVGDDALEVHYDGDQLDVGAIALTLLHTPGHTPGSQCVLVEGRLLSGDTLFIDGCGRTDFPGGDATEMYKTLSERLSR